MFYCIIFFVFINAKTFGAQNDVKLKDSSKQLLTFSPIVTELAQKIVEECLDEYKKMVKTRPYINSISSPKVNNPAIGNGQEMFKYLWVAFHAILRKLPNVRRHKRDHFLRFCQKQMKFGRHQFEAVDKIWARKMLIALADNCKSYIFDVSESHANRNAFQMSVTTLRNVQLQPPNSSRNQTEIDETCAILYEQYPGKNLCMFAKKLAYLSAFNRNVSIPASAVGCWPLNRNRNKAVKVCAQIMKARYEGELLRMTKYYSNAETKKQFLGEFAFDRQARDVESAIERMFGCQPQTSGCQVPTPNVGVPSANPEHRGAKCQPRTSGCQVPTPNIGVPSANPERRVPSANPECRGAKCQPRTSGCQVPTPNVGVPSANPERRGDKCQPRMSGCQVPTPNVGPVEEQTWNAYNIAALWMSIIHSVAGYLTAGTLFSLRLTSWQVFVALILSVLVVLVLCNFGSKPSQVHKIPNPVLCRVVFGVYGANIPSIIRMIICVAYFGVQTFLGSKAFALVILKIWPKLAALNDVQSHGFAGLSLLGWFAFVLLWSVQIALFRAGLSTARLVVDFAGPAVYVVMVALAVHLVATAGWANLNLNLSLGEEPLRLSESILTMFSAMALIISAMGSAIFSFSNFSRFAKSWNAVKVGNFLGLPVNYLLFATLTVVTISATKPVFGQLITDPIEMIAHIDSPGAVIVGGLTLTIASIGINIANFVCPACDLSNLAPKYISWHNGGLLAAFVALLLTPWNWYDQPAAIRYTLGLVEALMGPLYGIVMAGYYIALVPAMLARPNLDIQWVADFSWFVGCAIGFCAFAAMERINPKMKLAKSIGQDEVNA
uniref:Uncharacterized protein n=1 Tax=Globodera rostochiensis TaxID=31243 RepID=A0A914HGV0_GLORO